MKKLFSLLLVLSISFSYCQNAEGQYSESNIYKLNERLKKGDKNAIYELATYFDSEKILAEFLGHHYLETKEKQLAQRAIEENFIFPETGIDIEKISSSKEYSNFFNSNKSTIKYDYDLQSFYLTPINDRPEFVQFRDLPRGKIEDLIKKNTESLKNNAEINKDFEVLMIQNNPECLLKICQTLYRNRDRFNYNNRDKDYYYNLLKILIQKDIGPTGRNNQISWDAHEYNFDDNALLNLLIYFSKNHKNFKWDNKEKYFKNTRLIKMILNMQFCNY